ncbi:MAG: TRAP transporter substrate-binding protein DctP [Desulfobacterales bacterium]|nr:MAG: TRAP transporter substrate-binding protein DctP [Desulfobacterales bacterium]
MNRRNVIKAIGIGFLIVFLLVSPRTAVSKDTTLKIATLAPEGSAWIQTFEDLNVELKKKTNGAVELKVYPGGILGDEKDMIRKMYIGQIQGAVLTSAGLSGIFSEMDVFQIPFVFKSYEEVDYVLEKMDAFFKKGFADKGYVLPAWSEGGFVRLMSTVPIASLDDLKKAKVWTWEDAPMAKAIFDEAGVSAIPLSLPDVLVGLQTGLVEVVYAPPTGAISLQWFTKTKYMTDVPLIYLIGGILLKKKDFEKLSPAHQQTFMELCPKYMDQLKQVIRKENQEAIQVMVKHGVKIIRPSEDQIEGFKQVSQKAMDRQTGKSFSEKVRDEVIGYLKEYRKEKN